MTEEIKPEIIKSTQNSLSKFIKKPPLTEKLLKKPPFRFLHDIVTSVIRETGLLSGLYSISEMQSDGIKDRDAKINFLQKLIDCIKIVTEKDLNVRPSKIVAGLEPEKTNELLQAIGFALENKLNSSAAVAQLQGEHPHSKTKKSKDDKKTSQKTKEKTNKTKPSPSNSKTKSSPSDNKVKSSPSDSKIKTSPSDSKVKASPRTKKSVEVGKSSSRKSEEKVGSSRKSDEKLSTRKKDSPKTDGSKPKNEPKKERSSKDRKESKVKVDRSPNEAKAEKIEEENETGAPLPSPEPSRPDLKIATAPNVPENISEDQKQIPETLEFQTKENSANQPREFSAKESRVKDAGSAQEVGSPLKEKLQEVREKSVTPKKKPLKAEVVVSEEPEVMKSKEPPKIENLARPKTSLRPPSVRPSSARPGAPRLRDRNEMILPPDEIIPMGKVNVIVENFSTQEEDNEETVVVESAPELTFQEPVLPPVTDLPVEKGHLVAQILEQLGDSAPEPTDVTKPRVEIEWETGGNRNREAASREMEKLRDSIQTLTRAANPLGKLMNFLQEDVDSMRSELKMWMEINEKLTSEIKIQERSNEESILPLKKQLSRLEEDIAKQHEQIATTQANILKNEHKIKMLLTRDS